MEILSLYRLIHSYAVNMWKIKIDNAVLPFFLVKIIQIKASPSPANLFT